MIRSLEEDSENRGLKRSEREIEREREDWYKTQQTQIKQIWWKMERLKGPTVNAYKWSIC